MRSARKHRVSRTRATFVIEHPYAVVEVVGPKGQALFMHLGDDADGVALEVGVVIDPGDVIAVVHAMPLAPKYRAAYELGRDTGR